MAEIDRQFPTWPEGHAFDCPHWRSVFSSVFKEPKLAAHIETRSAGRIMTVFGVGAGAFPEDETFREAELEDSQSTG
jgi:hypothetical protein